MSRLLVVSMGIIPLMAFSVVVVTGILSDVAMMTLLKRGSIAGVVSGVSWGLVGYIFSSNKKSEEIPPTEENDQKVHNEI